MLGFINYFIFQWFFVRLARCTDKKTGEFIEYKFIFKLPLTGWIYKN